MSLRNKLNLLLASVAFTSSVLAPPIARAWDGAVMGAISAMDVTGGSNYGFRISLAGVENMCNGGLNWAYLNDTDSNYKTYVAVLMLSKAQASKVVVYSNLQGGFCHIGYISVLPGP